MPLPYDLVDAVTTSDAHVGSGYQRTGPVCSLARCHRGQLNQALYALCHILVFFWVDFVLFTKASFIVFNYLVWLTGKTCLQNDLWCADSDVILGVLTHSLYLITCTWDSDEYLQLLCYAVCFISMQALQDYKTSNKSLLTETSLRGMHGEPGIHLQTYSRSSSVASPVTVDSSCGSEFSTPPGSPYDQRYHSSGRSRQQNKASRTHLQTVDPDVDTGLPSLVCFLSVFTVIDILEDHVCS